MAHPSVLAQRHRTPRGPRGAQRGPDTIPRDVTVYDSIESWNQAELTKHARAAEANRDRAIDQLQKRRGLTDARRRRFSNNAIRSAALLEFYLTCASLLTESGSRTCGQIPQSIRIAAWRQSCRKVQAYFIPSMPGNEL